MKQTNNSVERVIGLDAHPDSFTAAILRGPTPAAALTEKIFHKVPMGQLLKWAKKQTGENDLFVLEASGNSFQIVRALQTIGRNARVLESCQVGKLKEAHANNDPLSAVRIAKAWLAGTAKTVWVPDATTQERRDVFHAHRKAVKRTTQMRNRLLSYLSDQGVRLKAGTELTAPDKPEAQLRALREWSAWQWEVISGMLLELRQADAMRQHWRSLIAQEVLKDPVLLSLVRLCGIRDLIAFALGAIVGDIRRFAAPRKLVAYLGLNPAFDHSGQGQWEGGIGGHGRKDLRSLLIEAAHSILRSKDPVARWGRKLMARKSSRQIAVAAVARKLAVAVWYLMMGRWSQVEEVEPRLNIKVTTIIRQIAPEALNRLGKDRQTIREQAHRNLQTGRVYVLDPHRKFEPKLPAAARPATA